MVRHFQNANRQLINRVQQIIAYQPENTRYQNWLIVFLLVLSFSLTFKKQSIEYFFLNPFFHCNYTDKLVNQNDACQHLDLCTVNNNHTLTVQMHLFCGSRKQERTFIQSLRGIGGWVGTIFVGLIADSYGRKICMLISLISLNLSFLTLIAGSMTFSISFFMISQFLEGVGNKFIFSISLIYMTRFLRKRVYETITNIWYLIGGGCSHILLAITNHFIHDWFLITLISFVPLLALLIICPFFIKEDPIYLFESQKEEEFRREVTWIGEFNGRTNEQILQDLQKVSKIQEQRQELLKEVKKAKTCSEICAMLCLNKGLLFHAIILGIIHVTCDFTLSGIGYSLQTFGFSYNINIALMGIAEILASLAMIQLLKVEDNRKRGFIVTSTIGFLVTLLMLFPFVQSSKIILTAIVFCAKFMLTCVFAFGVRVEIDSFPQKIQVSLMSVIEMISTTHGAVAPSLIQFGVDHHLNNIVFLHAVRFLFGTIPMLFVNDSRHEVQHQYVNPEGEVKPAQDVRRIDKLSLQEQLKGQ